VHKGLDDAARAAPAKAAIVLITSQRSSRDMDGYFAGEDDEVVDNPTIPEASRRDGSGSKPARPNDVERSTTTLASQRGYLRTDVDPGYDRNVDEL